MQRKRAFTPLEIGIYRRSSRNFLTGFTLIELLVVIAILAVLMAILMPVLHKAREQGQRAACKANLKNYTLAIYMYTGDNDDRFCDPRSCYFSQVAPYPVEQRLSQHLHVRWCNGDVCLQDHREYGGLLFPYLQDARSFICPTFKRIALRTSQDHFFRDYGHQVTNYKPWYNYTMNAYLGNSSDSVKKSRVEKLAEVKRPAETFAFTEESALVDTRYSVSGLNDTYMIPGDDSMIENWLRHPTVNGVHRNIRPGPGGVGAFWDVIAGFHHAPSGDPLGGKGNCAFLDGHVDAHPREETFPLAWPR